MDWTHLCGGLIEGSILHTYLYTVYTKLKKSTYMYGHNFTFYYATLSCIVPVSSYLPELRTRNSLLWMLLKKPELSTIPTFELCNNRATFFFFKVFRARIEYMSFAV